ncbi:hypothetical protein G7Y89_g13922 [Cudoniella acicularis]|uniref:Uncharacterized protein n=1 Tax=Cudoniella acicularis TaxID=354080 RepID=A0A8H4VVJ7_9HELO|nr:hypothetical protein G7Y89_g13922 [Cudoniella acicularis]
MVNLEFPVKFAPQALTTTGHIPGVFARFLRDAFYGWVEWKTCQWESVRCVEGFVQHVAQLDDFRKEDGVFAVAESVGREEAPEVSDCGFEYVEGVETTYSEVQFGDRVNCKFEVGM